MGNLIHNERTKYFATFFNNLGVAAFAAGAIVPLFSLDPGVKAWRLVFMAGGVAVALFCLYLAYKRLGQLKE